MPLEVAQGLEKYLSVLIVGWQLFGNILHCLQGFPPQNWAPVVHRGNWFYYINRIGFFSPASLFHSPISILLDELPPKLLALKFLPHHLLLGKPKLRNECIRWTTKEYIYSKGLGFRPPSENKLLGIFRKLENRPCIYTRHGVSGFSASSNEIYERSICHSAYICIIRPTTLGGCEV